MIDHCCEGSTFVGNKDKLCNKSEVFDFEHQSIMDTVDLITNSLTVTCVLIFIQVQGFEWGMMLLIILKQENKSIGEIMYVQNNRIDAGKQSIRNWSLNKTEQVFYTAFKLALLILTPVALGF